MICAHFDVTDCLLMVSSLTKIAATIPLDLGGLFPFQFCTDTMISHLAVGCGKTHGVTVMYVDAPTL